MALTFRNLVTDPADPVSTWPTEAVQTALERGDLGDWRRLAAEIRCEPWGRTAHQVEEVLTHARPYGIAEVMELVIERARAASRSRGLTHPVGFVISRVDDSFVDPLSDDELASRE